MPQRVSSINALRAAPPIPQTETESRNRLPVLHLTQPSVDTDHGLDLGHLHDGHPPKAQAKKHESTNSSTYRQSRGVPKRKSLNGLFGLSLHDRDHFDAKTSVKNDFGQLAVPQTAPLEPTVTMSEQVSGNGTGECTLDIFQRR